jgi:hypothetical protein
VKHWSGIDSKLVVQRHELARLRAQRREVVFLQRAGHHDEAVAAALDQEVDAFDGLAPLVAEADAERSTMCTPAARSSVSMICRIGV